METNMIGMLDSDIAGNIRLNFPLEKIQAELLQPFLPRTTGGAEAPLNDLYDKANQDRSEFDTSDDLPESLVADVCRHGDANRLQQSESSGTPRSTTGNGGEGGCHQQSTDHRFFRIRFYAQVESFR